MLPKRNNKFMNAKYTLLLLLCLSLTSCYTLREPIITRNAEITNYKYFIVSETGEKTGTSNAVYGNQYGVYGGGVTKSVNPSDIITGTLIKNGFIKLTELSPEYLDETMIVNYGESGKRTVGIWGYTLEVTIQFISAKTKEPICTCTAEGIGDTEADDIRKAIDRCLSTVFPKI